MAFVIVSIGIIFLRSSVPISSVRSGRRSCRSLPILSALVSLALMFSLPTATWERLIVWMAIGLAIYFGYGYRHSFLRHGPWGELPAPARVRVPASRQLGRSPAGENGSRACDRPSHFRPGRGTAGYVLIEGGPSGTPST